MKYYLTIAACVKQEAPYLKEWIDYHLRQGIEHFYLIDNESTDNTYDVLLPYILQGLVTYRYLKCHFLQEKLEMIQEFKDETQWIAIIDVDEYLVPMDGRSLKEIMRDYEEFSGLAVNWVTYGSSGHENRQDGILKNYTYHSHLDFLPNKHIKSIINPRRLLSWRDPHSWTYTEGFAVNENKQRTDTAFSDYSGNIIRINHYYTKSKEDWAHKMERGTGDCNVYSWQTFYDHDKNDIYDPIKL